jgi:hypothetical protein
LTERLADAAAVRAELACWEWAAQQCKDLLAVTVVRQILHHIAAQAVAVPYLWALQGMVLLALAVQAARIWGKGLFLAVAAVAQWAVLRAQLAALAAAARAVGQPQPIQPT